MQMESWRERGFVPDSDDEDGLESQGQEAKRVNSDLNLEVERDLDGDIVSVASHVIVELPRIDLVHEGRDGVQDGDPETVQVNRNTAAAALDDTASVQDGDIDLRLAKEPSETTYGEEAGEDEPDMEEPEVGDSRSTREEATPRARSPENLPTAGEDDLFSTTRPKQQQQRSVWDPPASSSPDILQLDHRPWRRTTSSSSKDKASSQPRPQDESMETSPLSSPLSSLHSSALDMDYQRVPEEALNSTLEDMLPPLNIPEDILHELDQPARRSLRQRNPIQLHPYVLEDAKYQSLMRARGLKPVRVTQPQERTRHATESQGQTYGDDAGSNSDTQMTDLQFAPSSPVDPRQLFGMTPIETPVENGNGQAPQQPRPSTNNTARSRSPKRRRVAGPGDDHQQQNLRPVRPQVVIENVPFATLPDAPSIFDIPSPPRSGSVSTPETQQNTTFRFPRGFSPPIITPRTETRKSTKDIEDSDAVMEDLGNEVDQDSGDARSVPSISSRSRSGSDVNEEDIGDEEEKEDEEEIVRKLQRKIKGVLPASWLRLDQQKQKVLSSVTQRNCERIARMEAEVSKGVARIITRRPASSIPLSARQLSSFRQLAEDSDQESGQDSDDPDDVGSHQRLASLFGFEDSVLDQDPDGDIPEDNRIDYMFPSISRNSTTSQSRKRAKNRMGLETDEHRFGDQSKKRRLKRQARLTDPKYGGRRTKQPSKAKNLPKLGILDAPDISSRPRTEQPQFLRVAARKARLRTDRGRQSPSRKVIELSSMMDTEDANASLVEWRAGRMQQTTLPRIPSQTPRRQPLMDLTTNRRDVPNHERAKRISESNGTIPQRKGPFANDSGMGENASALRPPTNTRPEAGDPAPAKLTKPVQQVRGNAWVIQRNLAITSLSRNNPRPVVTESVSHNVMARMSSSLQQSLARLNRDNNLLLHRFLSGDAVPQSSPRPSIELEKSINNAPKPSAGLQRRQLKKRPPTRLDLTSAGDYTPPMLFSPEVGSSRPQSGGQLPFIQTKRKLECFRTTYSIDFNISPLQTGIFFHESTFIGSGEFSRSLDIAKRDLDKTASVFRISFGGRSLRWSAWDDTVSSEFGLVFDQILGTGETERADGDSDGAAQEVTSSGCALYRKLVKYVSDALTFIDPIDRNGFVTRANGLVSKLEEDLSNLISTTGDDTGQLIRIVSHNVVFANQVCQIACHDLVNQSIRGEAFNLAKSATRQAIALIANPTAQASIRRFHVASKSREWREGGIKNDHPAVEAYVIVQHVLRSAERFEGFLEELVAGAFSLKDNESLNEKDIGSLEDGWHRLFTSLPLQEIDALGIARVGSRFKGGNDKWTTVKSLLRPVLDGDEANSESQPISYHSYCRVLLQRCFTLINGWGWRDCKPILDTLYDFFAKRTLYNLRLEESYGSPSFLDELDSNPSFEVLPGDSCFHVLLKIIATGLRFLSKTYDKKKIRNYAWRLLPNHGRMYPKEQPIRQEDLDALRNHHDLLCTLYSSVPDGCRPRLETIRNLVHPASSHRETCNISLRSWTRLVRFKLSANEDVSGLEPFAEWHGYFVTEFLKQHSLARREVEAQNNGVEQFSQQLIDRTITQNQKQIESLLKTALYGLQSAVNSAPTLEHARKVVSETPINSILGLFQPKCARLNATVAEALAVIVMYVQKCNSLSTEPSSTRAENHLTTADEDSQEYGDWADIAAVYGYESSPKIPGVEHVEEVFHPAVSRLVSNCFGEDIYPDDAILLSVVECWTSIAQILVRHKLRSWDSYTSPYEGDSWAALRWTEQTRKFTPQFLARCIEKDSHILSECKMQILGMWLSSLVERVSMLKYQHRLTEALLNQDENSRDPVLKNLPFSRDPIAGRYLITLEDLNLRRLSLISSLFSNMRVHIQDLDDEESPMLSSTRQDYRETIQKMMSSMKANYQELRNGTTNIQGAYVDFVQRTVGFLQQHTRDICPIDPFFTDPASFPLPSTDPTYIVARLKSYEPKLSSAKVAKTLVIFVQGISERAALDGQQTYLVNQLHASMVDTYEAGNPDQPTLRATLLQCVFPAYLATAFSNPAAWVLSRPIIETVTLVFKDLLFNLDTTDPDCVKSVLNMIASVFESSYRALSLITTKPNMLQEPTVLITATIFLSMITSALPTIDYIDRLPTTTDIQSKSLTTQIRAFYHFALFTIAHLEDQSPNHKYIPSEPLVPSDRSNNIAHSATRELQSYINESWSFHNGKYYFTRRGGHQPQEVKIEASIAARLDQSQAPVEGLVDAARGFLDVPDRLGFFGEIEVEEVGYGLENMTLFGDDETEFLTL